MTYNPNANWTAEVDDQQQAPVYYIAIDGLSTPHFSTATVRAAATTKKVYLNTPVGAGGSIDPITGSSTVGEVQVELLDSKDEITALIATEVAGAALSTLINRTVTVYGGYMALAEADYPPIYTGRVSDLRMNSQGTGYVLTLSDLYFLLDGRIMTGATDDTPAKVRGNIVNVYASILLNNFAHGSFPLDFVSTNSATTSAPTGLGISSGQLNTAQMISQRDTWHPDDVVEFEFRDVEDARSFIESEIFRVFQCWPAISPAGLLGLRFLVPPLPAASAPLLTATDHIVSVKSWRRRFDQHMNAFAIWGDYDSAESTFGTALYSTETADDTANQSATGERVQYILESRGIRTTYNGVELAEELAGRMRARYLLTPAEIEVTVNFRRRNIEVGDVVSLTHPTLPDLLLGTRGITDRLMTVVSINPDFAKGLLTFRLIDTGYYRYGVWAPAATPVYGSASALQKNTFAFWGNASNLVGSSEPGYRMI